MKNIFLLCLSSFLMLSYAKAQYTIEANNGQTITTCSGSFSDNITGNYNANVDLTITFQSNNLVNNHIKVVFSQFDVDQSDTLFIYDGINTTANLIGKYNNNNPLNAEQSIVNAGVYNTTGALTFRFKTNATIQTNGWIANVMCTPACQKIIASIDTLLTLPNPVSGNYINVCINDSVTFFGNGIFPENNIHYTQNNNNCNFYWDFGDSTSANGQTVKHKFNQKRGYNVALVITDSIGCASSNFLGTKVRISWIPNLHFNSITDLCTGDSKIIKVGYLNNSTILIDPILSSQTTKASFDSIIFIPDGGTCPPGFLSTSVTFTTYPLWSVITNASDIESICVNIEHTFSGDLGFKIFCPNGQSVVLDPNQHSGSNDLGKASTTDGSPTCSASANPSGIGWNYCWSEIYPNHGLLGALKNGSTNPIDSTDQANHTNYLLPANPLSGLIGCPINGTWNLVITDNWAIDNGYLFHWDIQLHHNFMPITWVYNVFIDSINITGPYLTHVNDSTVIIQPIIAGNLNYPISIFDNFGCEWDTTIQITVLQTPYVNLGIDTTFCEGHSLILNAGNSGSHYQWNYADISGSTDQTLITKDSVLFAGTPFSFNYIVKVSNSNSNIQCTAIDTIKVTLNPNPQVSFFVDTLSGCPPLNTIFSNFTFPIASNYLWDLGDGSISTVANPSHTYLSGLYTIKLTAISNEGCTSESINPSLINVYAKPPTPVITIVHGQSDTLISSALLGNQWYSNGVILSGETNSKLVVNSNINSFYTVVATNEYGCKSDSAKSFYVGINQPFIIYPNPFQNLITFKYIFNDANNLNISIYDITGRLIKVLIDTKLDNGEHILTFDTSNIRSGVYFYQINVNDTIYKGKILKIN